MNTGPVYIDYQLPLQKAILTRLEAVGIKELDDTTVVPIIDYRSENCPFPYVQIGEARVVDDFSTKCNAGQELSAQIDVWSRYQGFKEAHHIAGQVLKAITQDALDLSEFKIIEVGHEIDNGSSIREDDGETVRRMVRIRFKLQDTETIQ